MDDILISLGGEIKSLGGGAFEAPLVTFTGPNAPDLAGDFFTAQTDFWQEFPAKIPLLYNHGQDPELKKRRIGTGTLELKADSVWLRGQIALADEYQSDIEEMIRLGKLGTSSGSATHMVEREPVGKAFRLTSWPIIEASLTPTPCEKSHFGRVVPLTGAPAVKSFKAILQEMADAEADAGEQTETPDAEPPAEAPAQDASEAETTEAVKATDTDAVLDALEALPLKTFLEAMGAVASLTDRRLAWYAEQRETKQGRAISAENLAKMRDIHAGMQKHAADLGDIIARHSQGAAPAGDSQSSGNKPKALGSEMGAAFMRFMQAHGGTNTLGAPTAGQSVP